MPNGRMVDLLMIFKKSRDQKDDVFFANLVDGFFAFKGLVEFAFSVL